MSNIADKFLHRSRVLASDGFIVYDIQDEPGRSDMERPFPFRRVMDSSTHAALLARSSGRECLVYKCVADPGFDLWLERARNDHGHSAINLVGRATSEGKYEGPTIAEAMEKVAATDGIQVWVRLHRRTPHSRGCRGSRKIVPNRTSQYATETKGWSRMVHQPSCI